MNIKLGIAPINWCNDDDPNLGKDISFEQCIREMSLAGYVGTELGNKYPRDVTMLKNALTEQGLQLSSAWFSTFFTEPNQYQSTLSRFLDHLSFMRAMGASYINVCECGHAIQGTQLAIMSPYKPEFSQEQWGHLINGLHAIGRIAYDFNMKIVYHYHAGTGVYNEHEIDYLMQNSSPQLLSLLLDTGHAVFAGVDPLNLIAKYGDRIRYVHLKDIRPEVLKQTEVEQLTFMDAVRAGVFTVPGDGSIDFAPIFRALNSIHYEGWMIVEAEQDPVKAPPLEYARKAFDYLSAIL
ncbi:myo-inosose-2 dehydratase [Legionella bononiensis]|uniref:Myo-inosose-2 dehydratase n=1 Tax=Legionella bononiensis TaxID=2793102 RepID=A0ABS1WCD0_9GAMM|nr:myo-inosose-2 dehydratase [Legionella bononiensis]MBL7478887.1 myo-inosose-2 dehydratase [Legionella bononiensis]MBL7527018.1 myo-inosose-2 dehydratase [Legionella bononiensis]MBL7562389.1 myo-inosose-2 dehydratase [Legionella bononiensis]